MVGLDDAPQSEEVVLPKAGHVSTLERKQGVEYVGRLVVLFCGDCVFV